MTDIQHIYAPIELKFASKGCKPSRKDGSCTNCGAECPDGCNTCPNCGTECPDDQNEGLFEGYASVFNVVDTYGDSIAPGSFVNTLARMASLGRYVPMYANHGAAMGASALPIGKWLNISEDTTGLKVTGQLLGLETDTGEYIYELAKGGALSGISIAYVVKQADKPRSGTAKRIIREVELKEISLVDFPANPLANITSLCSANNRTDINKLINSIRDLTARIR
jgi:HK97 family phage prohead protease